MRWSVTVGSASGDVRPLGNESLCLDATGGSELTLSSSGSVALKLRPCSSASSTQLWHYNSSTRQLQMSQVRCGSGGGNRTTTTTLALCCLDDDVGSLGHLGLQTCLADPDKYQQFSIDLEAPADTQIRRSDGFCLTLVAS